jgi:hypothetical protein
VAGLRVLAGPFFFGGPFFARFFAAIHRLLMQSCPGMVRILAAFEASVNGFGACPPRPARFARSRAAERLAPA